MTPDPVRLEVTYVTAPACHLCDRGRQVLGELAEQIDLRITEVSLDSAEGRRLLATHRFAFPPAVLVEGRLVAHGRLSTRALVRRLARRGT